VWKQALAAILAATLMAVFPTSLLQDDNVFTHGSREEPIIALTFDDGPHPAYTDKILDVLAKHGVKATFFPIGVNVENYPEPLLRALEEGHEIGNHTYHHKNLRSIPYEEMLTEITTTAHRIHDLTGRSVSLIRPPQGAMSAQFLSLVGELGYRVVLWDVDTRDWDGASVEQMVGNIMANTDNGDIILFHDYHRNAANTVRTLDIIIPRLMEQGFRFVTVSELLDG